MPILVLMPILLLMLILVRMLILVLMLIFVRMLILELGPILVLMLILLLMLILVAGEVVEVASAASFFHQKSLPILALDQPLIYKLIMQCCTKETKGNLNWRTLSAP